MYKNLNTQFPETSHTYHVDMSKAIDFLLKLLYKTKYDVGTYINSKNENIKTYIY